MIKDITFLRWKRRWKRLFTINDDDLAMSSIEDETGLNDYWHSRTGSGSATHSEYSVKRRGFFFGRVRHEMTETHANKNNAMRRKIRIVSAE